MRGVGGGEMAGMKQLVHRYLGSMVALSSNNKQVYGLVCPSWGAEWEGLF